LSDPSAKKWIAAAASDHGLADLQDYVLERVGREDVLFLGIFEKEHGSHIGNIKYEPVLPDDGSAVMGILIGEPFFRGKGVFAEVFVASAAWLKIERQIDRIYLGVDTTNQAAVRAYQKIGFTPVPVLQDSSKPDIVMMVLHV
jgi:RimJ/RimL family protein N-acetyltransferase